MTMTVYCALNNDTAVPRAVVSRGGVAGEIPCLECGGSGKWLIELPADEPHPDYCVDCKGSGRILVSI